MNNYITHKFYCINCGKEAMPIGRKQSNQKEKFHRKRLWCFHCKTEINCVECRNEEEEFEFFINFNEGVFENEANESLAFCRASCLG